MTELRVESYTIPAAGLGPENPLPVFRSPRDDLDVKVDPGVPEDDRCHIGWRAANRVLPYRMQDGYDRDRRPRAFGAVVLENDILRAVVLPELGGRLVSLLHKPSGRELVECNPIFQPANLALRNAWFSGGIEWNASHFGHHYLTCSPVFAARVDGPRGEPALRIYEWDRVKCFPWQVDLVLPPGSPFLFARVRLLNPHDSEIPMYWWTNIGVREEPGTRTLVPADSAIHNAPPGLALTDLPLLDGSDITYPTNSRFAKEFFFRVPDEERHWIATLDCTGAGLFQASTARLRGRKMFCFGMNPGGRWWQEYLLGPGRAYYEIQAGLARTQLECVPMPGRAMWSWTEAFGLLEADPARVHSGDWSEARRTAQAALDSLLPQSRLDVQHENLAEVSARPPNKVLAAGSGWGALERRRLAIEGEDDRIPPELVFDDATMGPDQEPWLALLGSGSLPERDPLDDPGQMMVQPEWRRLLEDALAAGRGDHWLSWLHLGVMRLESCEPEAARAAWGRSVEIHRSGWALRNLAVLVEREGDPERACELLRESWEAGPRIAPLAVHYAQALARLERYNGIAAFVEALPEDLLANERIRIMAAQAAVRAGRLDGLEGFFDREFATIREGEVTLTDLWFAYQEQRVAGEEDVQVDDSLRARVRRDFPPPRHIDFRMGAGG